jgi:hypothetical protein
MKKTIDEKLNSIFEIPSTAIAQDAIIDVIHSRNEDHQTVDSDYEYARDNLRGLIENGKVAMENIIFLAKEGESPRAYEVIGQLIKTLSDTNKDLIELSKKVREAKGKDLPLQQQPQNVTNNSLFVGSTAELQKLINSKNE